jgi:hypothetical protein
MIPSSICNETNVLVDAPSSSVVAKVIDDFVGLFLDGITENDDAGSAEPDDVCDANSGGGY